MANRVLDILVKLTGSEKANKQIDDIAKGGVKAADAFNKSAKEANLFVDALAEASPAIGGVLRGGQDLYRLFSGQLGPQLTAHAVEMGVGAEKAKAMGLALNVLGKAAGIVGVTFAAAQAQIALFNQALNTTAIGGQRIRQQLAFGSLTGGAGAESLAQLRSATGGELESGVLSSQTTLLLTKGAEIEEIAELMKNLKIQTDATGRSFDQAFGAVSMGLVRKSVLLMDDFGVSIDQTAASAMTLDQLMTEVNAQLAETADKLAGGNSSSAASSAKRFNTQLEESAKAFEGVKAKFLEDNGFPLLLDAASAAMMGLTKAFDLSATSAVKWGRTLFAQTGIMQNLIALGLDLNDMLTPAAKRVLGMGSSSGKLNAGNGYFTQDASGNKTWVSTAEGKRAPGAVDEWVYRNGEWVPNEERYTAKSGGSGRGRGGGIRAVNPLVSQRADLDAAYAMYMEEQSYFASYDAFISQREFESGLMSMGPGEARGYGQRGRGFARDPRQSRPGFAPNLGIIQSRATGSGGSGGKTRVPFRNNGGGNNIDELMSLYSAYQSGGAGGLVGTGLGMVAANTLSAASLLGSAGGPVGMLLGSLVGSSGLFDKHQRETIRGPVAVEDKRTHDILGALNSTMNELIRLSTAGGADRLFADASRQAVAI